MHTPRAACAVAQGPTGQIYALGGVTATTSGPGYYCSTSVEIYDPQAQTWQSGPSLQVCRSYFGAALGGDGRLYAVGGLGSSGVWVTAVEALDFTTKTWTSVASLPAAMVSPLVFTTGDGKIYAAQAPLTTSTGSTIDVVVYDPTSNSWSGPVAPGLAYANVGSAAALLSNGDLLVGGGWSDYSNGTTYEPTGADAEYMGAGPSTWTLRSSAPYVYSSPYVSSTVESISTLVAEPSTGRVWALGGLGETFSSDFANQTYGALNTVWMYDPVVSAWIQ